MLTSPMSLLTLPALLQAAGHRGPGAAAPLLPGRGLVGQLWPGQEDGVVRLAEEQEGRRQPAPDRMGVPALAEGQGRLLGE